MMLLHQVEVECVEFFSKPCLISLFLEEPRRNVANDEHLMKGLETRLRMKYAPGAQLLHFVSDSE